MLTPSINLIDLNIVVEEILSTMDEEDFEDAFDNFSSFGYDYQDACLLVAYDILEQALSVVTSTYYERQRLNDSIPPQE